MTRPLRIVDLAPGAPEIEQVAQLLVDGFRDTGSRSWRTLDEAREEVRASLQPGRVSRAALDDEGRVLGWIGGIEEYEGNVWELHPLVVRSDSRLRGVGRALVADLERQVALRGGNTIRLGADDEDARTSLGGVDLYPDVLAALRSIESHRDHPFVFYRKVGYQIVGVVPDANGFGKPDILMAKRIAPAPAETRLESEKPAMAIHLDHMLVPSRNRIASAKLLAELLGVPWAETGVGPFSPVYVNDGLTLDFDEMTEPFPIQHYCFRVDERAFDAILGRIAGAGLPYRSSSHGPVDFKIDTDHGGRIVYWSEPDGHVWELLTISYARKPG